MKRFRNILVYTNGKDQGALAISRAADLAQQNSAKLALVDVVDTLPAVPNPISREVREKHDAFIDQKLTRLGQIARPLRDSGLELSFTVLQGNAAEQIVDQVFANSHDLVIKTAEEPQGIFRRLFGITAWRLMRNCPCPVWIIKATNEPKFQKVLAAVDPTPQDKEGDIQNIKILQLATSIAENDGSELHVIHVWPQGMKPDSPSGLPTEGLAIDGRQIDQVHHREGKSGDEIARLVNELDVQLLVMGTVGRSGMKEFLIGNTAERVLDQVDCSVLTVKPDDFVPAPRK